MSSERKKIYISFNEEDLKIIEANAAMCNMNRSDFIREMTLTGQVVNYRTYAVILRCISSLYTYANQIEDIATRHSLTEELDKAWLSLK